MRCSSPTPRASGPCSTTPSPSAYSIDDADLRTGVEIIGLATLAYENGTNVVRGVLLGQITGNNSVEARLELARLNAITDRIDAEMIGRSVGPFDGIPQSYLLTPEQIAQDELLKPFENTGSVDIDQMLGATQADESAGTLGLRADVTEVTRGLADDILSNAESRQSTVIALASLAIGAALVIFVLATYSITSPLRSLTRQARHMATDRLPKAVQSGPRHAARRGRRGPQGAAASRSAPGTRSPTWPPP